MIPASPLALTSDRRLDERRQRALVRYYFAAGSGGIAVGVHTTQFAIREPQHGLLRPVLELVADEARRLSEQHGRTFVRIGGIVGQTRQAVAEAEQLRTLGYHVGLLSLAGWQDADEDDIVEHCRRVADVIPIMGFYLQPAVGGIELPFAFWRRFAEIENVVAIKIAPFDRYRTMDVVRAIATSGREDIALYTGNDDNIVGDLLTEFTFPTGGNGSSSIRIVGGLLGHWACWTERAVWLLKACHDVRANPGDTSTLDLLRWGAQVTDCNAALFDVAHQFRGCISGIHEVLRRQGLLAGRWCLDPNEQLSPGQSEELDRIQALYPHLMDDEFVARHRDSWLA